VRSKKRKSQHRKEGNKNNRLSLGRRNSSSVAARRKVRASF
jgi:hypothetical protein